MVNFQDVIKDKFLDLNAFGSLTLVDFLLGLFISFLIGMFIYYVYSKCFRGVVYSHNYNISFVLITMITTMIIMTISTNIVLSLGMVGALSIVRFRTAVKDPLDIVYMFWAIAAGIATGAKLYPVAIIGSIAVGIVIAWLSLKRARNFPYLLVIHYRSEAHEVVLKTIRTLNSRLKSKTVRKDLIEMTVEVNLKDDNTAFMSLLQDQEGVMDVSLISYNGDYAI
ncbi:DUF4956 domain-containing protein [Marinicrinis sediminis]|uniref:DUF4956 domain-containing protein n=1 Tax=Marinicrinis sediminis TaxID=1652465 RepID=A0ABW5R6L4_9BACL